MTEQNLDELLRDIYQKGQPLPPEWNEHLRKRQAQMQKRPRFRRSVAAAVLIISFLGVPCSVYAYFHYMTTAQIADEMEQYKLAEKFDRQQDEVQTITSKGYRISYLGIVTGKNLEEGLEGAEVDKDKTYIVTAIQKENGKGMTDSDRFYVSPLIGGLEPIHYNLSTMGDGSAIRMIQDGVQYYITTCDSVEIFADRTLYLSIQEGNAPNAEAYTMDDQTGEITENEGYPKVNVLFPIQLDKSMANEEKAAAVIARIEKEMGKNAESSGEDDGKEEDVSEEDRELEGSGDYVVKFQGVTVKLLAQDGHRTLDLISYRGEDDEVKQDIDFFPVVQGEGIKKISFDIDGGLFYGLDILSEEEGGSLSDPYSTLYDKYIAFPHVYRNDKDYRYGMKGKGMDSICISTEEGKAEGQYMICVSDKVQGPTSSKTIRRDQKKVVKKIENMKVKMKIEKEDGSVIEKTITCKTKRYETKELDHDFYYYMYSIQ